MKIYVVGAGIMGSGIAQAFAQIGWEAFLYDISDGFAAKSCRGILERLSKQADADELSNEQIEKIAGLIKVSGTLQDASDSDLVIEAIAEKMEPKKALFKELDGICEEKTIFASNTSSLSITDMGSVTRRPHKVIGMHFSNPAYVTKFMEITRGLLCDDETYNTIHDIAVRLGKDPIRVKDGPGFVFNRIVIPMINEAIGVYAAGIATAEDIDKAIKLGGDFPIGPLELSDLVGNDITLAIMETLQKEMGSNKYAPHPLLRKMCRANLLGRKTGAGFYQY